jgi:CPA2 family monovalent cation:H+ antiporter-2
MVRRQNVCPGGSVVSYPPPKPPAIMSHGASVIAMIVSTLSLAYACALLARLFRLPNIAGYLLAGVIISSFTPWLAPNQKITAELAEIGVALLMFKIGLHFSPRDLLAVWHTAVPGALAQIAICTGMGMGAGMLLGWPPGASVVLGLAVAISSTAVATKALEERQQLSTDAGHMTLGWLVVQDIVVIVSLVLLPLAAHPHTDPVTMAILVAKTIAALGVFTIVLLRLGRSVLPRLLGLTARIGSQELFTLGVVVIGLGVAFGLTALFGMSLALGAFFAGLILGESDLSHQAAADSLPIQNIFTVLFFVSAGMLFDPHLAITSYHEIAVIVAAIVAGAGVISFCIMLALAVPPKIAGVAAGALAQIGEFTFVLTGLAAGLGIVSTEQQGLVLAAAIISIMLHFLTVRVYAVTGHALDQILPTHRLHTRRRRVDAKGLAAMREHVIIVGFGRVGSLVGGALQICRRDYAVVEGQWRIAKAARDGGTTVIYGDATRPEVLKAAHPQHAHLIVVALPDAFQTRRVIELARRLNPEIRVVARVHSEEEYHYLMSLGVGVVIMGEREIALSMSEFTLRQAGLDAASAQAVVDGLRANKAVPVPPAPEHAHEHSRHRKAARQ